MEYEIAEGGNTKELKSEVRKLIDKGFFPVGGMSIASWMIADERFWLLTQAMAKDNFDFDMEE